MFKNELKSLWRNKLLIVIMAAIVLIPSIYAGFFLQSMWDPYGDLGNLPVAVVNKDQAVIYKDKELTVGDDLAESLEENDSMAFNVVDEDVALKGLENGTYYMVITIPSNFSENATTLMDENPQQMILSYKTNPGKNYISMKLSESAMKQVKANLTEEITRTYTESVFDSLVEVEDGFGEAVDGTEEMLDGEDQLVDGNKQITDNLVLLADGSNTLAEGTNTLYDGLTTYTDGVAQVNDGTKKLGNGVAQLNTEAVGGAQKLATGANTLNNSIPTYTAGVASAKAGSAQLVAKNTTLNGGMAQVAGGVSTLSAKSGSLYNGLVAAKAGVDQSAAGLDQVIAGLAVAAQSAAPAETVSGNAVQPQGADAPNLSYLYQSLVAVRSGLTQVQTGLGSVEAQGTLLNGAYAMNQGLATVDAGLNGEAGLVNGVKAYTAGVSQLDAGLGTLCGYNDALNGGSKQLAEGASSLAVGLGSGVSQLQDGANALIIGTDQLVANNPTLLDGVNQLSDGANEIADGAGQLAEGSKELGDGLGELQEGTNTLHDALADGKDEIASNEASEQNIDMFVAPVDIEEECITTVANNGHGMAAYMMSVGLWVAVLAFCLMYPLTEYHGEFKNGFFWWFSKAFVAAGTVVVMSTILMVCLSVFNGFEPESMLKTWLVAMIAGMTFMCIQYFFDVLLGKVGSFMMLIFMVLQLTGSAGTYPIEISGPLANALHAWMPFTYSVDAFRATISGGATPMSEVFVMLMISLVFTIFTIFLFDIRGHRIKQGKGMVLDWIEAHGLG